MSEDSTDEDDDGGTRRVFEDRRDEAEDHAARERAGPSLRPVAASSSGAPSDDGASGRIDGIAALHRAVGNGAIQRLHRSGGLQARLAVGGANDRYEREAERIAGAVTGPAARSVNARNDGPADPTDVAGEISAYRASRATGPRDAGPAEDLVRGALATSGRPLPPETRSYFEGQFGADFSDVTVHTGPEVDEAARSIGAEAFTVGDRIAFARGNYRPTTESGRELLAHELTHVLQQRGGGESIQRADGSDPESREVFRKQDTPFTVTTDDGTTFGFEERDDGYVWLPPLDEPEARTYGEASNRLDKFMRQLTQMELEPENKGQVQLIEKALDIDIKPRKDERRLLNQTMTDVLAAMKYVDAKEGRLDGDTANFLARVGGYVHDSYHVALGDKPETLNENMRAVTADTAELDRVYRKAAERLHFSFVKGADRQTINDIGEWVGQINQLSSDVDTVISEAQKIADMTDSIDLPEFVQKLGDLNGRIGSFLDNVKSVTDSAKLIFRFTEDAPSEMFTMLNKIQAGFDTIDSVIGFVNRVPAFGELWSNYYKPVVDQCIEVINKFTERYDVQTREAMFISHMSRFQSGSGDPPDIPQEWHAYLPGGKPVFDYMWYLLTYQYREPNEDVQQFFDDHGDEIKAALPGDHGDSSIESIVINNPKIVWAMLYGKIPPPR